MARRPKVMPSSGPRLMVVRASLRAGACTALALTRLVAPPLPLLAKYTDACTRTTAVSIAHMLLQTHEQRDHGAAGPTGC